MYEGFKQLLSYFKRRGVFGGWGVGVGDWVGVSDGGGLFCKKSNEKMTKKVPKRPPSPAKTEVLH